MNRILKIAFLSVQISNFSGVHAPRHCWKKKEKKKVTDGCLNYSTKLCAFNITDQRHFRHFCLSNERWALSYLIEMDKHGKAYFKNCLSIKCKAYFRVVLMKNWVWQRNLSSVYFLSSQKSYSYWQEHLLMFIIHLFQHFQFQWLTSGVFTLVSYLLILFAPTRTLEAGFTLVTSILLSVSMTLLLMKGNFRIAL